MLSGERCASKQRYLPCVFGTCHRSEWDRLDHLEVSVSPHGLQNKPSRLDQTRNFYKAKFKQDEFVVIPASVSQQMSGLRENFSCLSIFCTDAELKLNTVLKHTQDRNDLAKHSPLCRYLN